MGFLERHKTNIYLQFGPVLQRLNTEEEQNKKEKKPSENYNSNVIMCFL